MGLPSAAELAAAPLSIVVFGPGFGESLVIRVNAETGPLWAVVDSARRERAGATVNPAQALLTARGATPNLVVLTHSHLDHTSGMADIVDGLRPGATVGCVEPLLSPPSPYTPVEDPDDLAAVQRSQTELAHTAINGAWNAGIAKWSTVLPTSFALGEWTLTVLHPDAAAVSDAIKRYAAGQRVKLNDLSASLLIEREKVALVLGADSEQAAWSAVEARLGPAHLRHTRPIKGSHHGSTNGIHRVLIDELTVDVGRDQVVTPFPRSGRLPCFDVGEGAERLARAAGRLQLTAMPVELIPTGGPVTLTTVRDALERENFEGDDAFDIRVEMPAGGSGLDAGVRDPFEAWVMFGIHLDGRVDVTRGGHALELRP